MRKYWREYLVGTLLILNFSVWSVALGSQTNDKLRVTFFDVGQGDAILIESPTHGRVLIDGGPNRKVLSELGKALPFGDRRIDVVIATHPDADHITGLIDTIERYKVGVFIHPGVESSNEIDNALLKKVEENKIPEIIAKRAMYLDLGGGARLVILFPDRDVSTWETNEASVVTKLIYGDRSFLLTGDSIKNTEYKLISMDDEFLDVDVLQAGHHGSDTSTSILFAQKTSPKYAVISAGENNRYGHPHKNVLDILGKVGAELISTAEQGTIIFETDGESLILK